MLKKVIVLFLLITMIFAFIIERRHYLENVQVEIVDYDYESFSGLYINGAEIAEPLAFDVYSLLKDYTMTARFTKMPLENQFSAFDYEMVYWVGSDHWLVLVSGDMNVVYKNEDWYIITNGIEFKAKFTELMN